MSETVRKYVKERMYLGESGRGEGVLDSLSLGGRESSERVQDGVSFGGSVSLNRRPGEREVAWHRVEGSHSRKESVWGIESVRKEGHFTG